jgi:predicted DNA-binding transcriptional regulator YafY
MKSIEGFFTQARRNLGPESSARLEREWLGKVRVVVTSQPWLPPKIVPVVFEIVSECLNNGRWLHTDYRNAAGKRNKVDVMPLHLVQQGPRLYLVCRYRGYDKERNLALQRILSAEMSTLMFDRPNEFDLKKYDDEGRYGFGDGEKIRLSFRIERVAGLHLMESPLSSDQQVVEFDDGTREITATVVDSAMLEWWLRGFGDAVSHVCRGRQHMIEFTVTL